jgi:hypothetical protein
MHRGSTESKHDGASLVFQPGIMKAVSLLVATGPLSISGLDAGTLK